MWSPEAGSPPFYEVRILSNAGSTSCYSQSVDIAAIPVKPEHTVDIDID
jgi:hypothetical protein